VPRARSGRSQRGFALLLVIWVLAILAVLAAGFAAGTRSETRVARNLLDAAQARALAEAGVALATGALIDNDPTSDWRTDGTLRDMSFDEGVVRIRIEDEGGKIDLNAGPPALLSGLCTELGIDGNTCAGLVDGVVSRRLAAVPPPAPVFRGLRNTGQPIGLGVSPVQDRLAAAFGSVEELRQLPAIDQATFDRLKPFVTVYSSSPRVDPAVAPREVLLAVPGINPREVERLLIARQAPPQAPGPAAPPASAGAAPRTASRAAPTAGAGPPPLPALSGVDAYVASGQLRTATVIAEAQTASGGAFTRRAVISLTGTPLNPTQMLEWRQDLGPEAAEQR
jgi:general secretion pathway protein K